MIDYHRLRQWQLPVIEQRYTTDDTLRYALALGYGDDPMDERQLQFVNDTRPGQPLALPTMAVVLGFPGSWMADPATGITFNRIVHGEEGLVMHRPLPASGTVRAVHRVTRVVDKGPGRGAVVTYDKDVFDTASGELLATVTHTTFARGDGGFSQQSGQSDEAAPLPLPVPPREPDQVLRLQTLPQQALWYRLCADRNPLHADPAAAQAVGFARPILHGLCTYGMAARALLQVAADSRPERLRSLFARFSAPVTPGEVLDVALWHEGTAAGQAEWALRVRVGERTVLDHGRATLAA